MESLEKGKKNISSICPFLKIIFVHDTEEDVEFLKNAEDMLLRTGNEDERFKLSISKTIENVKKEIKEKESGNYKFADLDLQRNDVLKLSQYEKFLYKNTNIKIISDNYSEDLYEKLVLTQIKIETKFLEEIKGKKEVIEEFCKKNNFNENKKYEVGDGDIYLWLNKEMLFMYGEGISFYFELKDENNFKIKILYNEYGTIESEIERSKDLNNKIEYWVCEFINGECVFLNRDFFIYNLKMYIDCTIKSIMSEKL